MTVRIVTDSLGDVPPEVAEELGITVIPITVLCNMRRVDIRMAFDTLEYLKRGGRIGKAQAFLGSVLKVNPVLTLKDGEPFPIARERS